MNLKEIVLCKVKFLMLTKASLEPRRKIKVIWVEIIAHEAPWTIIARNFEGCETHFSLKLQRHARWKTYSYIPNSYIVRTRILQYFATLHILIF